MRVAVVNVPTKVGPRAWAECFHTARQAAPVFGLNEVFSRGAKRLYLDLAERHGLGQFGTRMGPNPVFWDQEKWRKVWGRQHQIHGPGPNPHARLWPGFNGPRFVTELVLARRGKPRHRQVVVLNYHGVPEGRKVPDWWRRQCRAKTATLLERLVAKHVAKGRIVWVIGDTNEPGDLDLGPDVQWVRPRGVDKVGVALPADRHLVTASPWLIPAPNDHAAGVVVGSATWCRRSRNPQEKS